MQESNQSRPFYTIKIDNVNTKVIVNLNGEEIFMTVSYYHTKLELPVNQWITSGENKLEVILTAYEDINYTISPKAESSISLQVKEFGDFDSKPLTLSQVVYHGGNTTKSTQEGNYDFNSSIQTGTVSVSQLAKSNFSQRQGRKVNGLTLIQKINLRTPFPRWKFLNSQNIIEENYYDLDDDAYYKLRPREDIEALYQIHQEIYDALQKKDIDSIIDLFDERNDEMDIAMYKEKGYFKDRMYKALSKSANDESMEMLKPDRAKDFFYISEGGKTIYFNKFILFNKKDGSMNTRYDLLFRKEGNKWVLTR